MQGTISVAGPLPFPAVTGVQHGKGGEEQDGGEEGISTVNANARHYQHLHLGWRYFGSFYYKHS